MKKNLIFAAMAVVLASCSSEQVTNPSLQGDVKLDLNGSVTGTVNITKAGETSLSATTVGVYAWQTSTVGGGDITTLATTQLKNTKYDVDALGKFTANPAAIQLYKDRSYSACAYAPHKLTSIFSSVDAVPFAHGDDVLWSPATLVEIKKDDVPPTAKVVLPFVHKMAQIRFSLVKGLGDPNLTKADIVVTGFNNACTMNLATGAVTAGNTFTSKIEQSQSLIEPLSALTPVCIVPGSLTLQITVTCDGTVYKTSVSKTFATNESHELKLTLNKTGVNMSVEGTLVPWSTIVVTDVAVPSI